MRHRDRLIRANDALAYQTTFDFEGNDNLTRCTDRKGEVTGLAFDVLNRKLSTRFGAITRALRYLPAQDPLRKIIAPKYPGAGRRSRSG